MNKHSRPLLRLSALFAVISAIILGAHMTGAGSFAFRQIHAHI